MRVRRMHVYRLRRNACCGGNAAPERGVERYALDAKKVGGQQDSSALPVGHGLNAATGEYGDLFAQGIIDREGNVVERFEPTVDMKAVRAAVEELL